MDKLHKFTLDKDMMLQVKDYLFTHMKNTALQRVFTTGEAITGLKEAGEIITTGFDKMENEFVDKVDKKIINESI